MEEPLTLLKPRIGMAPLGPDPSAPRPAAPAVHAARAKPDARPMRAILGAGGLAAFSAIVAAIVLPPRPAVIPGADNAAGPVDGPSAAAVTVNQPIQYIQLQPGQTAPPGAKVIDAAAPQPVTVVTTVAAPAQKARIVKTTQSGKVVK